MATNLDAYGSGCRTVNQTSSFSAPQSSFFRSFVPLQVGHCKYVSEIHFLPSTSTASFKWKAQAGSYCGHGDGPAWTQLEQQSAGRRLFGLTLPVIFKWCHQLVTTNKHSGIFFKHGWTLENRGF